MCNIRTNVYKWTQKLESMHVYSKVGYHIVNYKKKYTKFEKVYKSNQSIQNSPKSAKLFRRVKIIQKNSEI